MLGRALIIVFAAVQLGSAEILDRIAATIDDRVIAESDILREIRLGALLNGARPDYSGPARRAAAQRLVERALMRREMEFSRYPLPAEKEILTTLENWRRERFKTAEAYAKALGNAKTSEPDLRRYLVEQLAALRFIDYRFRPGVQVLDSEVKQYYEQRFLPQSRSSGLAKDPPLEEVAERIQKILVEEKVDRMLDAWLKDARSRARIVLRPAVFQ